MQSTFRLTHAPVAHLRETIDSVSFLFGVAETFSILGCVRCDISQPPLDGLREFWLEPMGLANMPDVFTEEPSYSWPTPDISDFDGLTVAE